MSILNWVRLYLFVLPLAASLIVATIFFICMGDEGVKRAQTFTKSVFKKLNKERKQ